MQIDQGQWSNNYAPSLVYGIMYIAISILSVPYNNVVLLHCMPHLCICKGMCTYSVYSVMLSILQVDFVLI